MKHNPSQQKWVTGRHETGASVGRQGLVKKVPECRKAAVSGSPMTTKNYRLRIDKKYICIYIIYHNNCRSCTYRLQLYIHDKYTQPTPRSCLTRIITARKNARPTCIVRADRVGKKIGWFAVIIKYIQYIRIR